MKKIDYKKELKQLYLPSSKEVSVVEVPKQQFIMIDGQGDPNTSKEFQEAVEALFSLAYALKFIVKKGKTGIDYGVMPLEGLWWSGDMTTFNVQNKSDWKWTLMIMQPELVTHELFDLALQQVQKKKHLDALSKVRRMALVVKQDKALDPLDIGRFGANAVVPHPKRVAGLIE